MDNRIITGVIILLSIGYVFVYTCVFVPVIILLSIGYVFVYTW
jgi:hypothetical protein